MKQISVNYIPTLDGWRAVAVSLVLLNHSQLYLQAIPAPLGGVLASLFSHGGIGVDVFFALSGFLITSLLLIEKHGTGRISIKAFYVRRAFRIVPPIAAYLSVLLALRSLGALPALTNDEVLSSLFFVRNYFQDGSWYTSHFWSLAVEEHFYLLMPALVLLLTRPQAAIAIVVLAIGCIIIRYVEFNYLTNLSVNPQFRTENRVDALMWGAILAYVARDAQSRTRLREWLNHPGLWLVFCSLLTSLFLVGDASYRRTIVAILLPLLILYTVHNSQTVVGRVLELPLARWIGRLSYSLYIWHMLFFVLTPNLDFPALQQPPVNIVLSLALAAASYYWIEKPMIRIGHGWSARIADAEKLKRQVNIA